MMKPKPCIVCREEIISDEAFLCEVRSEIAARKYRTCLGCPDRTVEPNCHMTCEGYLYRRQKLDEGSELRVRHSAGVRSQREFERVVKRMKAGRKKK